MAIVPKKDYKKPKLKKDDRVLVVSLPDGPEIFYGEVTTVDSVNNKKIKVKGDATEFDETGIAAKKRAILVTDKLIAGFSNSSFLRSPAHLGKISLNRGMLDSIDAENEKKA